MSRKKYFNNLFKVFLVCQGILGLIIAIRQVTMVLVTNSLHKVAETDHFIFFATDRDEALYTSGFLCKCELTYDRIAHDINYHPDKKIVHRMFPSMRLLHLSLGNPFEWPADSIGRSSKFEFRELSPFSADWLKYSQMNFDMLFSHELTHILTDEINPDKRQNWLMEGLAVYEQFYGNARAYVRPKIHEHVVQGDVPDLNQLTGLTLWNFIEGHGYDYGYTVIENVVETYGQDELPELARTSAKSNTYLGMSAADFWEGWYLYLKTNY